MMVAERKFNTRGFLSSVFLFKSLEYSEVDTIAKQCSLIRPEKNTTIFSQGNLADAFYIVVIGKVAIYRINKLGEEQVIHIHSDMDVVAEAAIFDKEQYPANCKTLKKSTLLRVPKIAMINLVKNNPESALKIISAYSMRLRDFVEKVDYLSSPDVKIRILKFFNKIKYVENNNYFVDLKITKKELAQLLGTIPETLSRNLKRLKDDKIIQELDGKIKILSIQNFNLLIGDF